MASICRMKRERQRERRMKRRDLVHAAGCAHYLCCVRRGFFDNEWLITYAAWLGIRIPRSLRRHWKLDEEQRK